MSFLKKYRNRTKLIYINRNSLYDDLLLRKELGAIQQYNTTLIQNLTNKTNIVPVKHVWKTGDRYYKLAQKFYGVSELWWIIALYNQKPTEAHLKKGDIVLIPTPIKTVLSHL
tara:strand:- start:168 stop:506 length:339 start_codon:yes stop_codon:yes gene_type:complete